MMTSITWSINVHELVMIIAVRRIPHVYHRCIDNRTRSCAHQHLVYEQEWKINMVDDGRTEGNINDIRADTNSSSQRRKEIKFFMFAQALQVIKKHEVA